MISAILAVIVTLSEPFGAADLHLPEVRRNADEAVLLIHGGGWCGMSRKDVTGIADFLCDKLGFVVLNADYRLASKINPWPACGDDCIVAANYIFTDSFASKVGFSPKRIWVIGGSAGGHLALWTGLSLPPEKVAGIVSNSGIASAMPDFEAHPDRFRALFGGVDVTQDMLASMDALKLIRKGGPRVLLTHANGDKIVSIESSRQFYAAYKAVGNDAELYEYPTTLQPNLTGHCIWIPGSKPHRLIPALEGRIAKFMTSDPEESRSSARLASEFAAPPDDAKPWTYWLWMNGHTDEKAIAEDLEDIKALGFGGILFNDARGYWEDDDHIVTPKAEYEWLSSEQVRRIGIAMRKAKELGLVMAMNTSPNGGKLCGPWKVGADAPKRLMVTTEPLAPNAKIVGELPPSGLEHYHDICLFAIETPEKLPRRDWYAGGDGLFTMAASSGNRIDVGHERIAALQAVEVKKEWQVPASGHWSLVRIGYATMENREYDVDILDRAAIRRHFDRFFRPLKTELGDIIGTTLKYLYSVSWEGAIPNWSTDFEADYRRIVGRDIRPMMPILAGFSLPGVDIDAFMASFRRSRNDMFRENFYGTFAEIVHNEGMLWFSESGGPWHRKREIFGEADQLEFLSVNDVPQGEFWEFEEIGVGPTARRACSAGRWHIRGCVNSAHIYDQRIVSVEAFTHMLRHWSVDPATIKPIGDIGYADGANRYVWHTYTCSPERFGVPGIEYFAGTHINRNVTWHDEAGAFIRYLGRCQYLLQAGEPVTDIAVLGGDRTYSHWGRYRDRPSDEPHLNAIIPDGYSYDLVNDDAIVRNPALLSRYRVVWDLRRKENLGKMVDVGSLAPDATGPFTWAHRRLGNADFYYVIGEGRGEMTFRASRRSVEEWDAVTGVRRAARSKSTTDGRTRVTLDLPEGGSVFVVFLDEPSSELQPASGVRRDVAAVAGPWKVDFSYRRGVTANPPKSMEMTSLIDFTSIDALKFFAGTATYRTKVTLSDVGVSLRLSLGTVLSGLAHVYVNGKDCGTVWCAPWEADISSAARNGENEIEIRYINNWVNRLTGDCSLDESARITKSDMHYWKKPRKFKLGEHNDYFSINPRPYSGPAIDDPLQPSGLLGPVKVVSAP